MHGAGVRNQTVASAPAHWWASPLYRPPRPTERPGARVLLLLLAFWAGMVVVVVPWWQNTAPAATQGAAGAMTAVGQITGLVGGYSLLAQVLLMSRLGWLERWVGARRLLLWHRELGGFVVCSVVAHTVAITLGYAWAEHSPILGVTWSLLTGSDDMATAYAALLLLVGISLLSIRALRRALRYETWYYLHLTAYLALLLGYAHQFALGQELTSAGPSRYGWIAAYAAVVAAVVWGRVLAPLAFNLRHRLRVDAVLDEGGDMFSIYISGRRLDELDAKAGQFFRWRFFARGLWWQAHPFSLSAAPNEEFLRLTVKAVGDHTDELRWLRRGTRVWAEGPAGDFTAARRSKSRALLIAGGSGIAPIRALLEELPVGAVVIYRARSLDDLVFRRELDALAQARHAQVWYVLGPRDDPGPRRLFTPEGLRELVPDIRRRDAYLCGPPGLVDASVKLLKTLRLPRRQIHLDPFEF